MPVTALSSPRSFRPVLRLPVKLHRIEQFTPWEICWHPGQRAIAASTARFKVVAAGRKFGKTTFAGDSIVLAGLRDAGIYTWGAPTYEVTQIGYDSLRTRVPADWYDVREKWREIELRNGARIRFRSLENELPTIGRADKGFVIEEAARCSPDIWNITIRPNLMVHRAWALFISTPKGLNWFHGLYQKGIDPLQPDWASFQFDSAMNPHIDPREIAEICADLPPAVVDQEIHAKFLSREGCAIQYDPETFVKARCEKCDMNGEHPVGGVLAVDVAQTLDYCVVTRICEHGHRHEMERFNRRAYPEVCDRIARWAQRFPNYQLVVEQNSIGKVIIDFLRDHGTTVNGFMTTALSKEQIVNNANKGIADGRFTTCPDVIFQNELDGFEAKAMANGTRYGAPAGGHDDTVMSWLIGCWQLRRDEYVTPELLTGRTHGPTTRVCEEWNA